LEEAAALPLSAGRSVRSAPAPAVSTREISALPSSEAEAVADEVCEGERVRREALRTLVAAAAAEEGVAAVAMGSNRCER
jgi:hypothetical protein